VAKRKKIDNKALLEMIKEEKPQAEILKKFGLKNSTQLKVAYANALMESGEAPEIKGAGRGKKDKPVNTKIKVNARGSLIIPKVLVDTLSIDKDQKFEVKKTAAGISLKTVKEPAA
jgi:hypothetical protein